MNKSKFFLWCFLTFLILTILAIITRLHIQGRTWISWLFVSFRLLRLFRLLHNFFLKFLIYFLICLCFTLLLIAFVILFWGINTALKLFINPKTSFQYVLSCFSFFFGIFHHFLRKPSFIKFLYLFIVFFKFLKSCFTPNILLGVKAVR